MLHIVQVVFAGMAEKPRIFLDRAGAESAYVEHVKKCWKQSYSAYCESNGAGMDIFASAEAFLDTLDLSEKNRINYWVVNPEDSGVEKMEYLDRLKQRRENIENLVNRMEGRSAALRDELTGFLEDIAQLTDNFDLEAPPAEAQVAEPQGDAGLSPSVAEQEKPVESAERYTAKEWKAFVGSIMNMCGGNRCDYPALPRSDWRQEVYGDLTTLEYWDWVATKINTYREKAEKAGYAVIEDPDSPGHYKIRTPEGNVGEASFYSEWEAWCHAGMQLPPEPAAAVR